MKPHYLMLLLVCVFPRNGEGQVASPQNSYLSCKPMAARADHNQACVVTVALHTEAGHPASNVEVALRSSRGDVDSVAPATAVTDSAGRATFTVRSATPGTATLTAVAGTSVIDRGVVRDGAVAIYTFDGNSPQARVRDLSGQGNHGRLFGDPSVASGYSGDAIRLNGSDQYVEVPNHASMSGKVGSYVEAWVKTDAIADDEAVQTIAQKSFAHGGDYALKLHGSRIAYHYRSSQRAPEQLEEALSETGAVAPRRWTHTAGFWEGSDIEECVRFHGYVRAYASEKTFDATPKAQQVEGIWLGRTEEEPFRIGRNGDGSQTFRGAIDETRVYNRALYNIEMKRNHSGSTDVTFGLAPPSKFAADDTSLPECVILSWALGDENVTTHKIYRSTSPEVSLTPANLLKEIPHDRDHFRDYEVDFDTTYHYVITADSFGNESAGSQQVSATPSKAPVEHRWYMGDGHLHTFNHKVDVADFTPEATLLQARRNGWDFVLVTEHNSLGSYFRSEDQGTKDFIVFGNGQEISDGGNHRTGAFLEHFIPTSETEVVDQNAMALAMGGEVGPNHSTYATGPTNITLFELVNNRRWYPFDTWDQKYLKNGLHVAAKGGSDAHGRWSVKRGVRWCVWSDRLSYRALREAIGAGRTLAVDGEGLVCMLRINGAMIGDTLTLTEGTPLDIEISANCELGDVSEVKLIRFGETIRTWKPEQTDWSTTFRDGTFRGQSTYYRIEARSETASRRAVSSAIFVQPQDQPDDS